MPTALKEIALPAFAIAAALLLFRTWLAAVTPITGDEAYFAFWGWQPDWGFYDHPPMVGWWLAPLMALSWDDWVVRLPALLPRFRRLPRRGDGRQGGGQPKRRGERVGPGGDDGAAKVAGLGLFGA